MSRAFLCVALAAATLACDGPSKKSVAAYRTAQKAALERVTAQQKAFALSIDEARNGRWTPRPDLGACAASLPAPPKEDTDAWGSYPAWVVDDPHADGVAGWNHLAERVFKDLRESVGDPESAAPESEKDVVAATARLDALDPQSETDVLFFFVDELHRPVQTGDATFAGGDERGSAWVWSPKKKAIVCASTFDSHTPQEVLVTFFSKPQYRDAEVASRLMLSLRHDSIRSSVAHLVAAGPPK